jgi:hypothetical protein
VNGYWSHECYQSGTQLVVRVPTEPWLYVYGPNVQEDDANARNRVGMCRQLREWLNGFADRPQWLNDMRRVSETKLEDVDGSAIIATGPMVDRDPPKLDWTQDDSPAMRDARARLIDRLMMVGK